MAAMTSYHAQKYCHLVSAHTASIRRICSSVREFLIYSICVLVKIGQYVMKIQTTEASCLFF